MPLPASWADALFAKLTLRYGAAFMRQYADLNIEFVKDDWAQVLDGVSGDSIKYALENLPSDRPLNALQFRDLTRRSPLPELPKLPLPPADPARVAAAVEKIIAAKPQAMNVTPAQQCINNIERIVRDRGGKISSEQKHMVSQCLRMQGTSTTLGVQAAE